MRIKEQTDSHLVLVGIPGQRMWMIVLAAMGLLLTAGAGTFIVLLYRVSDGLAWGHLPLGFGFLIAQALFWSGLVTLAVGRQKLILDTTLGTGDYQVRSPVIDAGRPCRFDLKHVHSVSIETATEARPGRQGHGQEEATVHRVRLRLTKPRRAITLDETEHGRLERLEILAHRIAAFLGKEPEHEDHRAG